MGEAMPSAPRPSRPRRSEIALALPRRQEALREQHHAVLASQEFLRGLPVGRTSPLTVLNALILKFNGQHTAREKTVSHKTRQERAQFLQRFFRDLQRRAGFPTMPDPRNLGQRHIHAMVSVWQQDRLAPVTIQTYFSFLRGLSLWLGKPGLVRHPSFYGLRPEEYERCGIAQHDKSWRAQGIDIDAALAEIAAFDPRVAASIRLMHAFGLRRKESVTFRPFEHVVPFAHTGLPDERRAADLYLWVKGKGGRVRWLPVENEAQRSAVKLAQSMALTKDAHMGDPAHDLKQNLHRLDYVLRKFGYTRAAKGVTAHGLRHGRLNDLYEEAVGQPSPIRGGAPVDPESDRLARLVVAETAGHSRKRAACAYLGGSLRQHASRRTQTLRSTPPGEAEGSGEAAAADTGRPLPDLPQ
jgi:site-specific recombinase XerC